MNFIHSAENKLFYENAKFLANYAKKLDLANKVIAVYNKDDAFSKSATKEIVNLKKGLDEHNNEIVRPSDSLLYRKFYKAQQPVNAPANLLGEQKRMYLREHYFDNIDFTCEPLIRTDILSGLIPKFIALFESKTLTRTEQENNYIKAVESLLSQTSANEGMHKFMEQSMVQVFQYGEYDNIGAYIKEKQISSGMCMSDVESTQLKASIESIKRVSVGQPAPEIAITDLTGKSFHLSDIKYPYTLVVFWSSHCGHCTKMLPELSKIYKSQKNKQLEIVAISTETKRQDWLSFINNGEYNWINYLDANGYKSQTNKDYNIMGTPTFLLLDENKVIISKPNSIESLHTKLEELNLVD
jgi:thiol-disulfide isomerase/thioredoxin